MKKPAEHGLNEADFALVKKYSAQLDEAAKKYRNPPQQ
jgi:hypothetical protein